jgi:hypothetical protein
MRCTCDNPDDPTKHYPTGAPTLQHSFEMACQCDMPCCVEDHPSDCRCCADERDDEDEGVSPCPRCGHLGLTDLDQQCHACGYPAGVKVTILEPTLMEDVSEAALVLKGAAIHFAMIIMTGINARTGLFERATRRLQRANDSIVMEFIRRNGDSK